MAQLIIRRLQVGRLVEGFPGWPIRIDGKRVASIDSGKRVEIEITPGRHRVRVGAVLRSPALDVAAAPEETVHLAVRQDMHPISRVFCYSIPLAMLAQLGLGLSILSRAPGATFTGDQSVWLLLQFPALTLPIVLLILFLFSWRTHHLDLQPIPDPDLSDAKIAEYQRAHRPRVTLTIRQMMILVAVVAMYLGVSVEWARSQQRSTFRYEASSHATREDWARRDQQRALRVLHNLERAISGMDLERMGETGVTYGQALDERRQALPRAAANADYHAAMKRKYEEAAARGWLTVEPDPPEPPWP